MSYSSDKVKRWRNRTKKRIVEAMGGKCVVCNYSQCRRALDLHHLNSEKKEFGFGKIMANPKKWELLVKELRKCVLICCRCHAEVHDGLTQVPKDAIGFNEEYVSYKKEKEMDECPVCKGQKHLYNKTCSYSCAAKLSGKVDWDKIDLKDMLISKHMSYSSIGRSLDVSGNSVKKRAKKLGII
jgi:hypothetical protein